MAVADAFDRHNVTPREHADTVKTAASMDSEYERNRGMWLTLIKVKLSLSLDDMTA